MNIWLAADTHFGHEKFKVSDDHDERVLRGIGQNVCDGDVLIHLGDVAFAPEAEQHQLLLGKIQGAETWLVLGNHDHRSMWWYMRLGWSWVGRSMTLKMYGKTWVFTHEPMVVPDGCVNVHGHLHDDEHRAQERIPGTVLVHSTPERPVVTLKSIAEGMR